MKKLISKEGMTLIEMLVVLLILVMIIVSMDTIMDTSLHIYNDATFEADSATMAGIINTSMCDVLRYSKYIQETDEIEETNTNFVFTSYDYGIQDAYFALRTASANDERKVLQMRSQRGDDIFMDLVNTGAYPNLSIKDLEYFVVDAGGETAGKLVKISYFIFDKNNPDDPNRCRKEECIVRLMNAE